jgi:hypothetical protein
MNVRVRREDEEGREETRGDEEADEEDEEDGKTMLVHTPL